MVRQITIINSLISSNICPDLLAVLTVLADISGEIFNWTNSIQGIRSSGINYGNTNLLKVSPIYTILFTLSR
jgi:hypothetical protein